MRISDWSSDVCSSDLFKTGAEMAFRIISERGYLRHSLYFYDTPRSSHRSVEKEDFVRFLSVPMMPGRYRAGHGDDDGGTVETVGSGGAGRQDAAHRHGRVGRELAIRSRHDRKSTRLNSSH